MGLPAGLHGPGLRYEHLEFLLCPQCRGHLALADAEPGRRGRIRGGRLRCERCPAEYPIIEYVPRFVSSEGYAAGFGLQWARHSRTQYDLTSGRSLSRQRFLEETRWPSMMDGETVIEAGCGSGRFTEQALATGAVVMSLDYSRAVDVNYRANGDHDNLLIAQADLLSMPFIESDRLFCFGVLQHTPDPEAALRALVGHLKPGGELVADIYAKTVARYVLGTKYWVRPLTRRVPPDRLYRLTSRYVDGMWPVARKLHKLGRLGRAINWRLLIADHSDVITDDETLREWARLDTFDMLAPRFDKPATVATVDRWCRELGLVSIQVHRGYNGIELRARRADDSHRGAAARQEALR